MALEEEGLEDMSSHFLPRKKPCLKDGRTLVMRRGGWEVRSRTDYILGKDSSMLQNVAVQDSRHNTEHYLVLGYLCGSAPTAHLRYLGNFTRSPIRSPATTEKEDRMFDELRRAITRPHRQERHLQAWISPETWSLIVTRIEALQLKDQRISQSLAHAINAALQGDRCRQAEKAGSAVEPLLTSDLPLICKAWIWMWGWHKDEVD